MGWAENGSSFSITVKGDVGGAPGLRGKSAGVLGAGGHPPRVLPRRGIAVVQPALAGLGQVKGDIAQVPPGAHPAVGVEVAAQALHHQREGAHRAGHPVLQLRFRVQHRRGGGLHRKVSGSLVVAEMPLITASSSSFTTTRQEAAKR